MADANLIACLYPYTDGDVGEKHTEDEKDPTHQTLDLEDNSSRWVPARFQRSPLLLGRQSRASTAPLEEGGKKEDPPAYLYEDGLQLTFSHGPKGGGGFALGIHRNKCDIVLRNVEDKISRFHGYLTFDSQNRLILKDCSTHGTIVRYDGKGGEKRRNFTWILGGDEVPDRNVEKIVIEFHKRLKFQIVVPKHYAHLDQYIDNIRQFRAETAANEALPLGRLVMDSARSTAAQSGAHTPTQDRILLRQRRLGTGAFAVVTHFWDVSTGSQYACKKPRTNRFDWKTWKKEIDLMSQIEHVSRNIPVLFAGIVL
jgi:serine/threonine-protein kinase Chk2